MTPEPTAQRLPQSVWGWWQLWFVMRDDVGRTVFTISGLGLMAFKYAVEAATVWVSCGRFYSPLHFLAPLYSMRTAPMQGGPEWLPAAFGVWTLPFMWVALGMSIRRAANAGHSPWAGLLVLVPLLNYVVMATLCLASTSPDALWGKITRPVKSHGGPTAYGAGIRAVLVSLLTTFLTTFAMVLLSVYVCQDYGVALFLGAPVIVSATAAFIYNRPVSRSLASTMAVTFLALALVAAGMMLFALEGLICLAMAAPIVAVAGWIGTLIGKGIADYAPRAERQQYPAVFALPLLAMLEPHVTVYPEREIVTTVEISAPPEVVWRNVISFPDLPEATEWYFRLGISCPERARIDGSGVGAVRSCIFSTGTFVEPITVWDEPHRLAFDVTRQPHTMKELSPYRHVHAPHLGGTLRSRRGEFLLIALPNGRTRLEGRTWYDFKMAPQPYWTLWSDAIIHAIHRRVLAHIQRLSESETPSD